MIMRIISSIITAQCSYFAH